MNAIGLTEFGGPEVLTVVEIPAREPGPGEVRVRVQAVGVNPTDLSFRAGGREAELIGRPPPYIPGVDATGIVDKLGPESGGRLKPGDRVVALVVPVSPNGGSYAEEIVVPAASVVTAPSRATDAQAASFLLNALTARLALDALALQPGSTVVVTGGAGAVGGYSIEMAKADGLRVVACASAADHDLVTSLGADVVIHGGSELAARVRAHLPLGAPGLIDGAALDASVLPAVADGGGLVTVRLWSGPTERGIAVHPIRAVASATDTTLLERVRDLANHSVLTLRVAAVLPAAHAAEAHRRMEAGGVRGRLVLSFAEALTE